MRRNTGGFYRIFTFGNVVETATLSGMTVSNAFINDTIGGLGNGGAVSFAGKTLNIQGCVFSNNIAAGRWRFPFSRKIERYGQQLQRYFAECRQRRYAPFSCEVL